MPTNIVELITQILGKNNFFGLFIRFFYLVLTPFFQAVSTANKVGMDKIHQIYLI